MSAIGEPGYPKYQQICDSDSYDYGEEDSNDGGGGKEYFGGYSYNDSQINPAAESSSRPLPAFLKNR